jgi:hypothetical protein
MISGVLTRANVLYEYVAVTSVGLGGYATHTCRFLVCRCNGRSLDML